MAKGFWLVKQEPGDYSFDDLVKDGKTAWTGVRNFQARNNLRGMRNGDAVLFYHSGEEKRIVGIAAVAREAYPDPTAEDGAWSCVDLKAVEPLKAPVSLETIKRNKSLAEIPLVKQSRLSVMPLTKAQYDRLLKLG